MTDGYYESFYKSIPKIDWGFYNGLSVTYSLQDSINNSMKLSSLAKRLLDSDVKTLVKAGYLDKDLEITEKGQSALMAMLFEANKAELVKQAQEELEEKK